MLKKWLKYCTVFVEELSSLVCVQVTVAYKIEENEELDFPAVSVCPGFRTDKFLELGWPGSIYDYTAVDVNGTFPKSKKEMEKV